MVFLHSYAILKSKKELRLFSPGQVNQLKPMLSRYDFAVLDKVPEDSLVTFIISTYGEGEPTDNAVELVNFLKDEALELSDGGSTLPNLRFSVFCIGNSTYENFNTIGKLVDQRLEDIGATRIGICGIGDEDKALEEDYITWKDELWLAAETQMGWQNGVGVHSADFELNINPKLDAERIYLGELTESDLTGSRVGFQDPRMLFTSAVIKATDLFQDRERNCIFAEFDITASRMSYETGDHVGIWPVNSDADINRLLRILDLELRADQVFDVKSLDPGLAKVPFPVPTTYLSIFRYYLDISQLTPRQTLEGFIKFAPTDRARAFLEKIGVDKDFYQKEIAEKCFNLGDVLLTAAGDSLDPTSSSYTHWNIPFERIISASSRLRPRYYSICSSPRMFPNSVHVAAVVMKDRPHADSKVVYGLTTNYLLNLKRAVSHEDIIRDPKQPIYSLEGP